MKSFRNIVAKITDVFAYIGMAVCFVMVFVVAIDVVMRKLSNGVYSIKGSNEFSSYFLILICVFAIPMFQVKRGHIWVNMFVDKFPPRFRSFWLGGVHVIETCVCLLFTYGSILKMKDLLSSGRATDILHMPFWPFALALVIGFGLFTLLIFIDTIQFFIDGAHGGEQLKKAEE